MVNTLTTKKVKRKRKKKKKIVSKIPNTCDFSSQKFKTQTFHMKLPTSKSHFNFHAQTASQLQRPELKNIQCHDKLGIYFTLFLFLSSHLLSGSHLSKVNGCICIRQGISST